MTDFLESFTPGLPAEVIAATAPCPRGRRVAQRTRRHARRTRAGWGLIERGADRHRGRAHRLDRRRGRPARALGHAGVGGSTISAARCHARPGRRPHAPGLRRQRAHEFELRLQGATYEDIAKAGGGIRSTVTATRAASEDALFQAASRRLETLRAGGVTTVEIKSGYGLSYEDEAKCLRVARRLGRTGVCVRTTSLELVAPDPSDRVPASSRNAPRNRRATSGIVADQMAQRVVDEQTGRGR